MGPFTPLETRSREGRLQPSGRRSRPLRRYRKVRVHHRPEGYKRPSKGTMRTVLVTGVDRSIDMLKRIKGKHYAGKNLHSEGARETVRNCSKPKGRCQKTSCATHSEEWKRQTSQGYEAGSESAQPLGRKSRGTLI